MSSKRRRGKWSCELSNWKCDLCGRSADEIGDHPLPVRQRAHLFPNRLTGKIHRYKGVKNSLDDNEWTVLIEELGPILRTQLHCDQNVRAGCRGRP